MGAGDDQAEMEAFWDERARENSLFFVDSRVDYQRPDAEQFWTEGEADLTTLFAIAEDSISPEDRVLEIGCGLGRLTRPIARQAREVIALDVSEEMLSQARQLNPSLTNVRWLHGDGTTLAGVDDASVDLCVSHVVFQHLPDPKMTLGYVREMGRALSPGGRAVICFSNKAEIHQETHQRGLQGVIHRLREWRGKVPRGMGHPAWLGSAVAIDDLQKTANEAQLAIERLENPDTQYCVARLRRLET